MASDIDDQVCAHHNIGAEPVQQARIGAAVGQEAIVLVRSSWAASAENGSHPTTASSPPIVASQGALRWANHASPSAPIGSKNEAATNALRCAALMVSFAAALAAMLARPVSWVAEAST